ncbi:hypothetical protein [Micromonospora coxensis]|uniref:hypothetical protein n=1 Tax=Micromonospora coxensis TaxID=356852 RepID=UPI00341F63D4
MVKKLEGVGYRMLSRFVPTVEAKAYDCVCTPGTRWGINGGYCWCSSDCRSVLCRRYL